MPIQEPFFFGQDDRLFGAYHGAEGMPKREAVLIVGPLLNEGMRAHLALRQMAVKLAASGYDVLRFDFSGMGNSLGHAADYSVADWQQDTVDAANELKDISGADGLSIIAVRFGAAMALSSTGRVPARQLLAWDPLLRGSDWLARLRIAQQAAQEKRATVSLDTARVFSGHYVGAEFVQDLEHCTVDWPAELPGLVLTTSGSTAPALPDESQVDRRGVDFSCSWESMGSQVLYPHQIVSDICERL